MRHYSHIANKRSNQIHSQVPREFDTVAELEEVVQQDLHAAISGGHISRRLSEISQGFAAEDGHTI